MPGEARGGLCDGHLKCFVMVIVISCQLNGFSYFTWLFALK